jgi:hypothetical protein
MEENLPLRRRRHKRYGQRGTISLRWIVSGPRVSGSTFDLSAKGALIWLNKPVFFDPAEVVEVRLQLDALSFRALGFVRHTSEEGHLLGVEFHRLNPQDAAELDEFIKALDAQTDLEKTEPVF